MPGLGYYFKFFGLDQLFYSPAKCASTTRLDGKTVIVTGSSRGIGKSAAKEFYKLGARVILVCEELDEGEEVVNDIKKTVQSVDNQPLGELVVQKMDLGSLRSIKLCAKNILLSENRINILVINAGVLKCLERKTEDGFETHFGVNHLGHFLFTCLLLPRIMKSTPSRIVIVSSIIHELGTIQFGDFNLEYNFSTLKAYAKSKLANVLFSYELGERLKNRGVNVYCLHPEIVQTKLLTRYLRVLPDYIRNFAYTFTMRLVMSPDQGAQTTIYCAIDENLTNETGCFYSHCKKVNSSAKGKKTEDAKKLWILSAKLVGLSNWDPFNAPSNLLPHMLQSI